MLTLQPDPKFWAEVEISVPGKAERFAIQLEFKYRDKTEYQAWEVEARKKTDQEAFADTVTNWAQVDSDFTRENFAKFLEKYPASALEIFQAYRHHSTESRRKNSQGLLSDLLVAR